MPENADIYHNEENATHCTSVSKTSTSAAKLVITVLPLWSIRRNGCRSSHLPQAQWISLLLPANWKGKLRCLVQMEMSKAVIIPLLRLLVLPHPEHCVQLLAPTNKKEVKVLEHVQSRTTKLVKRLEGTSCDMACEEWWQTLACLVWRRGSWTPTSLLQLPEEDKGRGLSSSPWDPPIGCGNSSKVHEEKFRLDTGKHFCTKRVAKPWNRLPGEVVNAPSLLVFKRHLDNVFNKMV